MYEIQKPNTISAVLNGIRKNRKNFGYSITEIKG